MYIIYVNHIFQNINVTNHFISDTLTFCTLINYIRKPPQSGELYVEITEFMMVEDHLILQISTYSTSDEGGFLFIS